MFSGKREHIFFCPRFSSSLNNVDFFPLFLFLDHNPI